LEFVISIVCGPYHAATAASAISSESAANAWWGFAGVPVGIALTVFCTIVPMRVGARNLRAIEF